MEGQEEVVVCEISKGKRTKRPRPMSPTTTTTSSGRNVDDLRGFSSPTISVELTESSTEEEEDMANCLILLAQGQTRNKPPPETNKPSHVHQCKTCNRCLPSFQALGGHRASHRKPKWVNADQEQNKGIVVNDKDDDDDDDEQQFNSMNTTLSLQITNTKHVVCNNTNNKSKIHECSICGAEFSSGQALGGHMRRHRTLINPPTTTDCRDNDHQSKKPRTVLQLDLNLPAPEDELHRETKFSFPSKEKLLVFSATSLVDCHY